MKRIPLEDYIALNAERFEQSQENPSPQKTEPSGASVRLVNAASVEPEPIDWLWEGYLAKGKFHVLAGTPEAGKTTLAMDLAATVTTGGTFPDGSRCEEGHVIIWSGEDGIADTLCPRLSGAGAKLENVSFIEGVEGTGRPRSFDPAKDMEALSNTIERLGNVKLLIVDPVVQAVAKDAHKGNDVRRELAPLIELGMKHGVAILGITHFSKGTVGRDPSERVLGSVAFSALPRIVLVVAKDRTVDTQSGQRDRRILSRAKSNIGPSGGGFAYGIEECTVENGVRTTHVVWAEALQGSAAELLHAADEPQQSGGGALQEACDFLLEALGDGPAPATEVQSVAEKAGITKATLRRAQTKLGVQVKKSGFGKSAAWLWSLPDAASRRCSTRSEDAHPPEVSTFAKKERLRGAWEDPDDFEF
jgi:putative DNA primase/helicase